MLIIILIIAVIMILFPGFLTAIFAILGMCLLATLWAVPPNIAGPVIAALVIMRFVGAFLGHIGRFLR